MGDVYRADDLKLGQAVALKFLPESLALDPDRLERLFAEVRLARQVSHRNVCRVYDIVEHGSEAFLSMEFIDGEDLASLLRRAGRLGPEKATEIARQICAGLQAAHEKGILHRDLKPANILIDSEGVPHIADFGLAGVGEEIAGQEIRAGTPSYMAPEQVAGRGVTIQSDLYALGLLLYEMYTGKRALGGKSIRELEERRSQLFTQTSTEFSTLDPMIERAITRCLELDPTMRPNSALAVAASLPGGDPLAAALAAGELPSPEMIAASGSAGTLALPIGLGALLAILVGMTLQLKLAPHTFVHEIVGLPKAVPVLAERSATLRREFGYPDSLVADQAMGWLSRRSPIDYEEFLDPEHPSWDSLSTGQPSPITFWYREAPSYLIPSNLVGAVGPIDPPLTTPNMVSIYLSPRGDLRGFHAVPSATFGVPDSLPFDSESLSATNAGVDSLENEAAPTTSKRLDVARVFAEAELDMADFEPVPRDWTPPHFADELYTFRGRYRDRPSFPINVRIAGLEGRLVWLDIVEPWEQGEGRVSPGRRAGKVSQGILQGMVIFLIFSAALLARQNVRSGLGDRRGAARLATFATIAMAGSLIVSANHVPIFQPEWNMINVTVGIGLVLGGLTWMIYVALEPFARRIWPETLISWSRLLQGRLNDPRVGRDLLLGIAAGTSISVARPLLVSYLPTLGQHAIAPIVPQVEILDGFLAYVSAMMTIPLNSIWIPMAILLLAIGIRSLVRNQKLAIALHGLFFFIIFALGSKSLIAVAAIGIGVAIFMVVLFRLGLLAVMVLYLTIELYGQLPIPSNLGAWYAWPSVVTLLGLFALALHGFRLSRRHT